MSAPVLHTSVLDALGREIVEGRLTPGTVLRLEDIQDRFGVSRTVAREAMRLLEALRVVTSKRRVGLIVRPPAEWDVFDPRVIGWRLDGAGRAAQLRSLTELRAAVEPLAAGASARFASAGQRLRLISLADRLRRTGEAGALEEFLALDIEFHSLLLVSSGNEMFAALADIVAVVLTGRTRHGLMPARPRPQALAAHEAVAWAVHDREPDVAERAMSVIVSEVRAALSAPEQDRPAALPPPNTGDSP